jgi:hypothetical protein
LTTREAVFTVFTDFAALTLNLPANCLAVSFANAPANFCKNLINFAIHFSDFAAAFATLNDTYNDSHTQVGDNIILTARITTSSIISFIIGHIFAQFSSLRSNIHHVQRLSFSISSLSIPFIHFPSLTNHGVKFDLNTSSTH